MNSTKADLEVVLGKKKKSVATLSRGFYCRNALIIFEVFLFVVGPL